jgi:branched-chain amino acid transport system substrate-binding protein
MSRLNRTRVMVLGGTAALALIAAACGSSGSSGSSSTPVKIGFFGALTGPNAQLGINEYNGVKLAVDQFNAKGGQQVQLIQYDSQGDPAQAPTLAQKAISDKVVGIVGPAFSGESKAADPIFQQAQIVNVTASATNPKLADNGWTFWHRVVGNDNSQGPAAALYIQKKLNATSVAVIDDGSEYGRGIADIVRNTLTTAHVTLTNDKIDPNSFDYTSTVDKVKAANPQAVFFGGYYSNAGPLVKQLRDAQVTATFVSDDGTNDPKYVSAAGTTSAEGSILTCPCGDVTGNPQDATFVSDYSASSGQKVGTYSAEAFDAANVILAAIKAGNHTGPKINSYLASHSFSGITKLIKFDSRGEVNGGGIYAYQVKSGQIVVLGLVTQVVAGG